MIETEGMTLTIEQAMLRHQGLNRNYFLRRCERAAKLLREYGTKENVPLVYRTRVIFGKKVGRFWMIPASELNRFFL